MMTSNKSNIIEDEITDLLNDDEHITWYASTQRHYAKYGKGIFARFFATMLFFLAIVVLVSSQRSSVPLDTMICFAVIWIIGIVVFFKLSKLFNPKNFTALVNVITNERVFIYSQKKSTILYSYQHQDIHKITVREYGKNKGNIIVDKRDPNVKARYLTSAKNPVAFELKGVDNLRKVVGLLSEKTAVKPYSVDYITRRRIRFR